MTAELSKFSPKKNIILWFHGFEVRDYRRLAFNYSTEELELRRPVLDSLNKARFAAVRKLDDHPRIQTVFVSDYIRGVARADCEAKLENALVIPNFIDGDFFAARVKTHDMARRILLIRSFEARNYANDIAIGAIQLLARRPEFGELQITIRGTGRYFRSLTAPLAAYANVDTAEVYLSPAEIKALHDAHGLFLVPSRHDTQGVTMCEAMASGLVCITNPVAAIPEYFDETCGYFARPEFNRGVRRRRSWLIERRHFQQEVPAGRGARPRAMQRGPNDRARVVPFAETLLSAMAHSTPLIVCANADVSEELAARLGANRISVSDGRMEMLDPSGRSVTPFFPLPEQEANLQSLAAGSATQWNALLDNLCGNFAAPPHIFLESDHPLRELFLLGSRRGLLCYSLYIRQTPQRLALLEYAIVSAAVQIVFADEAAHTAFCKIFVGAYQTAQLSAESLETGLQAARSCAPDWPEPTEETRLRVLIVAYFAGHCSTVGAKRVNYWFDQMQSISGGKIEVELASAMPYDSPPGRHHYVPNYDLAEILDAGSPNEWQMAFMQTEADQRRNFTTLSHYWRLGLERYFDARDCRFDVVIISGNPFSVFDFAKFARRKWSARVVLDYRDPFAFNPRFKYSDAARAEAAYVERGYNLQADLITVVNDDCIKLVAGPVDAKITVVMNGYDERQMEAAVVARLPEARPVTFVHAGSIFHDRSPTSLVKALDPDRHRFIHVGSLAGLNDEVVNHPAATLYGPLPYVEALARIAGGHIGVVFLSESGFETPTKLYDYVGLGLELLICTHGPINEGPIARLFKDMEGVHWCRNTPKDLSRFVESYTPGKGISPEIRYLFSRRHGLEKLIEDLEVLARGHPYCAPA